MSIKDLFETEYIGSRDTSTHRVCSACGELRSSTRMARTAMVMYATGEIVGNATRSSASLRRPERRNANEGFEQMRHMR